MYLENYWCWNQTWFPGFSVVPVPSRAAWKRKIKVKNCLNFIHQPSKTLTTGVSAFPVDIFHSPNYLQKNQPTPPGGYIMTTQKIFPPLNFSEILPCFFAFITANIKQGNSTIPHFSSLLPPLFFPFFLFHWFFPIFIFFITPQGGGGGIAKTGRGAGGERGWVLV